MPDFRVIQGGAQARNCNSRTSMTKPRLQVVEGGRSGAGVSAIGAGLLYAEAAAVGWAAGCQTLAGFNSVAARIALGSASHYWSTDGEKSRGPAA